MEEAYSDFEDVLTFPCCKEIPAVIIKNRAYVNSLPGGFSPEQDSSRLVSL